MRRSLVAHRRVARCPLKPLIFLLVSEKSHIAKAMVEPGGIEPPTSSMPLSGTAISNNFSQSRLLAKTIENQHIKSIPISGRFQRLLFGGDLVAI